jgi:signal peptidase I
MSIAGRLLSGILLALEDPWVVFACVVVTLLARVIYLAYRRAHPQPIPVDKHLPPPYRIEAQLGAGLLLATGLILVLVWMKAGTLPGIISGVVGLLGYVWLHQHFRNVHLTGKWGERLPEKPYRKPKDIGLEVIDTLLIAFILVFGLVRPFLLQTFFIPSASMEPTLLGPYNPAKDEKNPSILVKDGHKRTGDKLIANRFVLRFRPPRRGEVVIFKPPNEALEGTNADLQMRRWIEANPEEAEKAVPYFNVYLMSRGYQPVENAQQYLNYLPSLPDRRDDYIKRVIGVPGDRIRINRKERTLYVNDNKVPLHEPYLTAKNRIEMDTNFPPPPPLLGQMPVLRAQNGEELTGGDYELFGQFLTKYVGEWYESRILYETRLKPYIVDGNVFRVPDNCVFVMGDNRSHYGSFDSRFWGVVPLENIKGRAVATFWPPRRLRLL